MSRKTISEHHATSRWKRETESFAYRDYNREHRWEIAGHTIAASAAPAFHGRPEHVDPEEAFVASLSSCHMLSFLAICARKKIIVDAYEDDAIGFLERAADKKLHVARVVLRPRITFADGHEPTAERLQKLHHLSHEECFIARSVKTEISIE